MLNLPDCLTAESFLERHWQKSPLFMPVAIESIKPRITRNELGWLATLDDVESRLVFAERDGERIRYRAETGPFSVEYLQRLPKRDWTLLVHDVEKHLPVFRALFQNVSFIPDWRIDDLMVSFAAPGGGVGPHRDNYDVFLCQGIGVRNWRFTLDDVDDDPEASEDLALLCEFASGESIDTSSGDVLYLPPGVAHWGTAKRACITYSIGMRAPEVKDLAASLKYEAISEGRFYRDPDLGTNEAVPGYLSSASVRRAIDSMGLANCRHEDIAESLGKFSTLPKDSLMPDVATPEEAESMLEYLNSGGHIQVHGMASIAFDDQNLFVNGTSRAIPAGCSDLIMEICSQRSLSRPVKIKAGQAELLIWMAKRGAFELNVNS